MLFERKTSYISSIKAYRNTEQDTVEQKQLGKNESIGERK